MIGNIISGLGSLVGGLIGGDESSKGKKKSITRSTSNTSHTVRLRQMVRAAEKAGFNPLTVLNAGGLAAFTSTRSNTYSKTKEKFSGSSTSSAPLGAGIAGALNAVGGMMESGNPLSENAAGAWQAPTGQPSGAAELALVNAQLSSAEPILRPPVSSTYSATPVLAADDAKAGPQSEWKKPTQEQATATNPLPKGSIIDQNSADADAWETRYGEMGGVFGGAVNAINDFGKNWPAMRDQFYKDAAKFDPLGGKKFNPKLPVINRAGPSISGNLWDPPSIQMALPPVVEEQPKPPLWGGGGW